MEKKALNNKIILNVIPLRNMMMLPKVSTPLLIGRENTLVAVKQAIETDQAVLCVPQKRENEEFDYPTSRDMHRYGTMCMIVQDFPLPEGSMRLLCEGMQKVKVKKFYSKKGYLKAEVELLDNELEKGEETEVEAYRRNLVAQFSKYIKLNNKIPNEMGIALERITDLEEVLYFCLNYLDVEIGKKQKIFQEPSLVKAFKLLVSLVSKELSLKSLETSIDQKVKGKLSKSQREYFLHEQLRQIHNELGISEESANEYVQLKTRINNTPLTVKAKEKLNQEMKKLARISNHSQEYSVLINYVEWVLDLPWSPKETGDIDILKSQKILDKDHYGLKDVKERILEHIAVMQLNKSIKGQIICFAGPPGVGKTSLGKSIAESLGREFVRISLGGVGDESEIRGHRRTYIGAIPGIIMDSLKKGKSTNPLIMMDEIDKLSSDFRGDPAAALLEVLDPEQNSHFRDHYIDIEYDLSNVVFITTANNLSTIPRPLLDRMEVVELPGYTEFEKLNIAKNHLVSKQLNEHGIGTKIKISFTESALEYIIKFYTREAGVRELDRKIAKIIRKIIKDFLTGKIKKAITINKKHVREYLGVEIYSHSTVNSKNRVGIVNGLAWTAVGGETLTIEVIKLVGEGKISLTGQLGDVMKESAQAAISYARLHGKEYGIDADFYKNSDIHLHIPEGAVPKDGPSAGVTMATAIISVLSNIPVYHDIAMTGEITLSGDVLPIGGLPEKLIAAKREGIKRVLIPHQNVKDLENIQDEIKTGIEIIPVKRISEVLKLALVKHEL